MISIKHWAIAATVAVVGTTLVAGGTAAKSSCVRAGGEATMITEDLARFMANAALKNSISGMGAKPAGQISMTCAGNMGMTSCKAFQRACK
jgi:hypothetical protein